ncbi:MAG: hypothetical protein N2747_08885 [Chitinophagaceae bacterium]|nr:hypothetical protein [Chitinophagaceae bacterium]
MKKIMLIWCLFLTVVFLNAQNDPADPVSRESKIRDRMQEYIQRKLNLNRQEAEKFTPVFVRYFKEFVQTHRSHRDDRLVLQQKIIELRIRYRDEFRQILDENKANNVFRYEDEFRIKAREVILEQRRQRLEKSTDVNRPVEH